MEDASPQQRLVALAESRGISLSALSRMLGRNPSYLQQFVRKGSPRKLDEEDRARLARFFAVDEAQLGGKEDISYDTASQDWVEVPRLALGASAGPGVLAGEEHAIGAFRFSGRWLREQGLSAGALSAIEVVGDSMEPTLRDGDEILVDRSPRPVRDGIHVVRVDDTLMVKRLDTARPGWITLLSDNHAYRPLELAAPQVELIGRVVWKSGRI